MRNMFRHGSSIGLLLLSCAVGGAQLDLLWARGGAAWGASYDAVVAPNGERAALISGDSFLRVVRLSDGMLERLFALPSGAPNRLALSPDGTMLAIGTNSSAVWLVRFEDGAPLNVLYPHSGAATQLQFTSDGEYLVTAQTGEGIQRIRLSDFLFLPNPTIVPPFAVAPDRTYIAGYGGGGIQIRRWDNRALVRQAPADITAPTRPAFSPDGQYLLNSWNGQIHAWHLFDSARDRLNLGAASSAVSFQFTPDGTRLLVGGWSGLLIYDGASFQRLGSIPQINSGSVALCPDSDHIIAWEFPRFTLWSLQQLQRVREITHFRSTFPTFTVPLPDGETLLSLNERQLRWWDAHTGALIRTQQINEDIYAVAASPTTPHALLGTSSRIQLIRADTGQLLASFSPSFSFRVGAFTPDGDYFCYAGGSPLRLEVRASATGALAATLSLQSATLPHRIYLLSPSRVILAHLSGVVELWSIPQARLLAQASFPGIFRSAALSADGALLALASGEQITVWGTENLTPLAQWSLAPHSALGTAISPCRRYIAVGDSAGRLGLYRMADGALIFQRQVVPRVPSGTPAELFSVVYDPRGRYLASVHGSPDLFVHSNPLAPPASDVNGDGCVDDADLLAVLFAFGQAGSALGRVDVNGDGVVDDADLLIVLFNFGAGCG